MCVCYVCPLRTSVRQAYPTTPLRASVPSDRSHAVSLRVRPVMRACAVGARIGTAAPAQGRLARRAVRNVGARGAAATEAADFGPEKLPPAGATAP